MGIPAPGTGRKNSAALCTIKCLQAGEHPYGGFTLT